jgi:hypothetical protein
MVPNGPLVYFTTTDRKAFAIPLAYYSVSIRTEEPIMGSVYFEVMINQSGHNVMGAKSPYRSGERVW